MWKIFLYLQKKLVFVIPASMIAGILHANYSDINFLKNLIVPFTFLMVYPMMINMKLDKLFQINKEDKKLQLLTQFINFALIPFIALVIGNFFFADNKYILLGLLLAALLPTSGMTISWTGFAKGNLEGAVKITIIGLTLGSVATPFYLKWLLGTSINMNLGLIFKQIALIVFIPMILGYATQKAIVRIAGDESFKKNFAPKFSSLSTLGVLGIVFIATALKAQNILSNPVYFLYLLIPIVILYILNFSLSTLIGKILLSRENAIALVYGTVMRNLSIALAIALNTFGEHGSEIALIICAAYVIQVQSAGWYVKYTDLIFGKSTHHRTYRC